MSMKAMEDLRETLCSELDEIARKGEMSAGDLEAVHKLTDTIKNIDKIIMLEEGGYSQAVDTDDRIAYGGGNSYANRGRHWVRGHYSRDGGDVYDGRRDNRGRYSRADGKEHMMEQLHEMMEDAPTERQRAAIKRCMEQLENE